MKKTRTRIPGITHEQIKTMFDYRDGYLVWATWPGGQARPGKRAGHIRPNGYYFVGIRGDQYLVHRIIFFWHHGYLPENEVDHINQDPADNRIENLREVSRQCNLQNSKQRNHTTSGIKGVTVENKKGKWVSSIKHNGRHIYLGSSHCLLEAACLRLAGEQSQSFGECDRQSPALRYVKNHIPTIRTGGGKW